MEDRFSVHQEERCSQEEREGLPDLDRHQRGKSRKEEEQKMLMRAAAIYARVSAPRQGREQTIESQLTVLKSWADENAHELSPENVYTDEGYSGSRLDRPGLDALRDGAEDGAFEVIGVLSPDRLARKYAYQVLLLEELGRSGCEVVFVDHPISEDPNDQLLLQIQGAIAEYERALLGDRFRRGKLQKRVRGTSSVAGYPTATATSPRETGCLAISSWTRRNPNSSGCSTDGSSRSG
jgi:DNA invertase Pin-like site-specific DNA recombinase